MFIIIIIIIIIIKKNRNSLGIYHHAGLKAQMSIIYLYVYV
jgi:hypothetical protein